MDATVNQSVRGALKARRHHADVEFSDAKLLLVLLLVSSLSSFSNNLGSSCISSGLFLSPVTAALEVKELDCAVLRLISAGLVDVVGDLRSSFDVGAVNSVTASCSSLFFHSISTPSILPSSSSVNLTQAL